MGALDKSNTAVTAGVQEFPVPGKEDDIVAVFYVPRAKTADQLQQMASSVRTTTQLRRIFTYLPPRAVAARGTAAQIAAAGRLFKGTD